MASREEEGIPCLNQESRKKTGSGQSPEAIARDSMERYCGCSVEHFKDYLLLTNFPPYVDLFAKLHEAQVHEGTSFKVCHSARSNISILDFKMGSPMAALVMDLCKYLPFKGLLMLGMAGGLRDRFQLGDFFVPVGSIRAEGTSDFYFPPQVPALGNFVLQRLMTETLELHKIPYHLGITYTTNRRFWEFNEPFIEEMMKLRPHAIEMECATLFTAGNKHKIPIGALLLISDLPLQEGGIKTKESAQYIFDEFMHSHLQMGVEIISKLDKWQNCQGAECCDLANFVTRDGPGAIIDGKKKKGKK